MKTLLYLTILAAAILATVGCNNNQGAYANAAAEMQIAAQGRANDIAVEMHETQLRGVELTQDDVAVSQLRVCFLDGSYDYPRRANLDGSVRPIELSNRIIARCDRILKTLARSYAQQDADEKSKDAAYDKAHAKGGR
jgi:hypothetical protein